MAHGAVFEAIAGLAQMAAIDGSSGQWFGPSVDYTEPVQKDPLVRTVDAQSMRLQLQRRDIRQIAMHPVWQEAAHRLEDRLGFIKTEQTPRLDHGLAQYGLAMNPAPGSLQMVWSVGLLAYLSDLRSTLGFWARALKPGGLLMLATLGPDSFRSLSLALDDPAQERHVPGYPDMHDIGDALVGLKMTNPVMDAEWLNLTYSTAESALADLRRLGGNPLRGRPPGLSGRAWRARVLGALESLRAEDGRIVLRIELVFGHAWTGIPKSSQTTFPAGESTIQWIGKTPKMP
jgi:SAM-dependent methyltransferase